MRLPRALSARLSSSEIEHGHGAFVRAAISFSFSVHTRCAQRLYVALWRAERAQQHYAISVDTRALSRAHTIVVLGGSGSQRAGRDALGSVGHRKIFVNLNANGVTDVVLVMHMLCMLFSNDPIPQHRASRDVAHHGESAHAGLTNSHRSRNPAYPSPE